MGNMYANDVCTTDILGYSRLLMPDERFLLETELGGRSMTPKTGATGPLSARPFDLTVVGRDS
jgi:hypothetical protein